MSTIEIDVRGQDCPIPLMELKKALETAEKGQIIELTFTCPEATANLPDYCEKEGIEILSFNRDKKAWKFAVRK